MNILTKVIKEDIHTGIIDNVIRIEYNLASKNIADILVKLYTNIPDKTAFHMGLYMPSRRSLKLTDVGINPMPIGYLS
jgi:hypothetical protein